MPKIAIIVAIDANNGIGKNNQLLCHLPNDLKHFKQLTSGNTVIMGRKTYESLPNGALPNRRNIVITRQHGAKFPHCDTANSLEHALKLSENEEIVFIIGGASIYEQALSVATILYVTKINATFEADTFFPPITNSDWTLTERENHHKDEKHSADYAFETWLQKTH